MTWDEVMSHNMDQLREISFALGRREARLGLSILEAAHAAHAPLIAKEGRASFKKTATRLETVANHYD